MSGTGTVGLGLRPVAWRDVPAPLQQVWAAARLRAADEAPYLATALLALEPRALERIDGEVGLSCFPADRFWRLSLDLSLLAQASVVELAGWLVHHIGHLLRQHADRATALGVVPPDKRWAVAADCEVGDDLPVLLRPASAPVPGALGLPQGRTAEEYVDALDGRDLAHVLDCGSALDGVRRTWEADGPGLGSEESRLLRHDVARRLAALARGPGSVPEGWLRWAENALEPLVDWRSELRACVRHALAAAGHAEPTYRRRSRRADAVPDAVLPGAQSRAPRVCLVLDTSQSMTPALLSRALAEVGGVVRALGVGRQDVIALCCDAEAQAPARVIAGREIRLLGGGGTDLRVGLTAAAALHPRPDVILVLTDGATDWPDRPPSRSSVVIGLLDDALPAPSWARTVRISSREEGTRAYVEQRS